MRYLIRPGAVETLILRGRHEFRNAAGEAVGEEVWERYRNDGSPVQSWRGERRGEVGGTPFALLSHAVVSPDGLERVKLRLLARAVDVPLTITPVGDAVWVNLAGEQQEIALPPGFGISLPLPSLAAFAFPFDLGETARTIHLALHLRVGPMEGTLNLKPIKFAYEPLGLRDFALPDQQVRGRGWRMVVPGLPAREGWFGRQRNCLALKDAGWEATVQTWRTFG